MIRICVLFLILLVQKMQGNPEEFLHFCQSVDQKDEMLYKKFYHQFLENITSEATPKITIFGGAPGAGKTTWRKLYFAKEPNVYVHDMDEVLIALPGYQEDLKKFGAVAAFEKWWPTARKIADELMQFALKQKYSILYDRTCGAEGSYHDLFHAKQLGYQIHFFGFCISPEVGLARIVKRQKEEGRAVTSEIFEEYRARFSALWPYYLNIADTAILYETSDHEAMEIFSLSRGPQDPLRYRAFLDEGKSFQQYFNERLTP